jgi:hypothetical protein
MKTITVAALVLLAASPALAAGGKKKMPRHDHSYNQISPSEADRTTGYNDPYVARSYNGRRIVGRDPDPNIRQSLRDEDAFFRNGD